MIALVNTVVNSAAAVAATNAMQDERDHRHRGAGHREPERREAGDEEEREERDPGLARAAPVGERAEQRAADRDQDAGRGGRVAPQRLPVRRIADDGIREIGREQERQHQRVVGLRRPVEEHPRDERSHRRPLSRGGGGLSKDCCQKRKLPLGTPRALLARARAGSAPRNGQSGGFARRAALRAHGGCVALGYARMIR